MSFVLIFGACVINEGSDPASVISHLEQLGRKTAQGTRGLQTDRKPTDNHALTACVLKGGACQGVNTMFECLCKCSCMHVRCYMCIFLATLVVLGT